MNRHWSGPAVEDREDHGVDPHRLARAGGAGDQQVGHPRQVGDVGLAADGLAQRQGEGLAGLLVFGAGEQVAQIDGLAAGVGQLDADGVAAGTTHTRQAATLMERAMSSERATTRADFTPGAGHQFVEGDHRAGADLVDLAAHAELGQDAFQQPGVLAQGGLVDGRLARLGLGQHRSRFGAVEAAGLGEGEASDSPAPRARRSEARLGV